ncbi:MAG: lysophospholipid acyltransferase family protein [Deltaproteobacteria bacterium]|nr:lysophospholipid acyltransferase family protein [Deltaproteobacteria bacterium]
MAEPLEARLNDFFDALATYTFTPLTLLKFSKMLLGIDNPEENAGFRPEKRDPKFVSFASRIFKKATQPYFRPEVHGLTNLPAKGAGLIVGNHNGGLVPVDTFIAGGAIARYFGASRPVYGLAHDFLFRESTLSNILERMGALKATYKSAELAFEREGLVIVYPGGDIETFRPFKKRHKIDFGNRTGFIRLALQKQVPVYPCVSIGCHETFYVLTRGEKIAKIFGFKKKLRTTVFPIVLSFPWGLTSGFLPYIPLPSKIIIEFLPALDWSKYGPEDADNPEVLQACSREIIGIMQTRLNKMAAERNLPLVG